MHVKVANHITYLARRSYTTAENASARTSLIFVEPPDRETRLLSAIRGQWSSLSWDDGLKLIKHLSLINLSRSILLHAWSEKRSWLEVLRAFSAANDHLVTAPLLSHLGLLIARKAPLSFLMHLCATDKNLKSNNGASVCVTTRCGFQVNFCLERRLQSCPHLLLEMVSVRYLRLKDARCKELTNTARPELDLLDQSCAMVNNMDFFEQPKSLSIAIQLLLEHRFLWVKGIQMASDNRTPERSALACTKVPSSLWLAAMKIFGPFPGFLATSWNTCLNFLLKNHNFIRALRATRCSVDETSKDIKHVEHDSENSMLSNSTTGISFLMKRIAIHVVTSHNRLPTRSYWDKSLGWVLQNIPGCVPESPTYFSFSDANFLLKTWPDLVKGITLELSKKSFWLSALAPLSVSLCQSARWDVLLRTLANHHLLYGRRT